MPTKRMVTPRARPFPFLTPARRRRRSRMKNHVRLMTRSHDPGSANHSRYASCLRVAKVIPTLTKIMALRDKVANAFRDFCLRNELVAGVLPRDLLANEGKNLASCMADIKHRQWASKIETCLAEETLNVQVNVDDGHCVVNMPKANLPYSSEGSLRR